MTGWTTSRDLIARLDKLWGSGRLLADRLDNDASLFPLTLPLRKPASSDLTDRFEAVRTWVSELADHDRDRRGHGYRIEWRSVNHRTLGRNRLPWKVVVPSADDALRLIGKRRQAERFDELTVRLLSEFPGLRGWLMRRPLEVLNRAEEWPRLEAVVRYFREHPRPGLYLRQLDIPGVDTKFIQARRGLVGELLDIVLPRSAIDETSSGVRGFNQRYGVASPPILVRFRILDPALTLRGLSDLSVPAEEFARLDLPVDDVFITENEINGLAFPDVPRAIVIFGLGYGLERLADTGWLARANCWYWGDIDTHGFAMLDRLRRYLPATRSFLMDRATLDAHRERWGREQENQRFRGDADRLDEAERALYQALLHDHLGTRVRLEQEHVRFDWLARFLDHFRATS